VKYLPLHSQLGSQRDGQKHQRAGTDSPHPLEPLEHPAADSTCLSVSPARYAASGQREKGKLWGEPTIIAPATESFL